MPRARQEEPSDHGSNQCYEASLRDAQPKDSEQSAPLCTRGDRHAVDPLVDIVRHASSHAKGAAESATDSLQREDKEDDEEFLKRKTLPIQVAADN